MLSFVLLLVLITVLLLIVGALLNARHYLIFGALWAWLWLALLRGYGRGGWLGVLLISLPAIVAPPIVLYLTSRYLLPLRDPDQQHRQAFKSFIAFILGTNFPYHVVHSRFWGLDKVEQQMQMGGSPFNKTMPGPGVIISRCDHAPVVSDGVTFKDVRDPGLSFTGSYDAVPQAIDLRPQLRAFDVEARTQDGIGIKVLAFTPFQISRGRAIPQPGHSFPFRKKDAFLALHKAQRVEHTGKGQTPERTEALLWDDLPQMLAKPILRDIIAQYRFNDLCAPYHLREDPRTEIAEAFKKKLKKALEPYGITLIGGGISNLLPADKNRQEIFKQRIHNWRVHWVRHIMHQQAEGHRSRLRQIEKARAQAQIDVIRELSNRLARLQETKTVISSGEIVDLFIDMIKQMAARPTVRRLLPSGTAQSLGQTEEDSGS